jgi:hypothetical protein
MRLLLPASVLMYGLVLLQAAHAQDGNDQSASVERARRCDAATKGKHLTEEQYRVYMQGCLVSEGPPRDPLETARTIERRCNTFANEQQLSGQDRVQFMETCRRKG